MASRGETNLHLHTCFLTFLMSGFSQFYEGKKVELDSYLFQLLIITWEIAKYILKFLFTLTHYWIIVIHGKNTTENDKIKWLEK